MSDRPDIGYDYKALDEIEKTGLELAHVMGYDHIEWRERRDHREVWMLAFREGEPMARTELIGFPGEILSRDLSTGRYPLDRPMIFPGYFGKLDMGIFTLAYHTLKRRLEIESRKLTDGKTSREFLLRFGRFLHDKYQEKYPINSETQLIEIETDYHSYAYGLPFTVGKLEIEMALFERWGLRDPATWVALAYAPEINTVFVRKDNRK